MRAIVTGGAGYIGSQLAYDLHRRYPEWRITVIDNEFRGSFSHLKAELESDRVDLVKADIADGDRMGEIFKERPDIVFHLAAVPGLELCSRYPRKSVLANVYGTLCLLEAAVRADVSRFVFTSSMAVYGAHEGPLTESLPPNPINPYGIQKMVAEKLLEAYSREQGLDAVALRVGNVYGVGLYTDWITVIPKFVRCAVEGKPLTVYGNGGQARDFIHIRDVVRAIERAATARKIDGHAINVASGKSTTINEVVEVVKRVTRTKLRKDVGVSHVEPRRGEVYLPRFEVSLEKATRLLGCRATVSLHEGVEGLFDYALESQLLRD
ncbi:MAG: NAD-dependent epimerase/dehydratase family protein [Candidatus Bathyarchaeia archaeon]